MALYRAPKLVSKLFRNLASAHKQVLETPIKSNKLDKFYGTLHQYKTGYSKWTNLVSRYERRYPFRLMSNDTKKGCKTVFYYGVAATVIACLYSLEVTPYEYRLPHVVLVPKYFENKLGEHKVGKIKEEFKEYVLPPDHPLTVRVSQVVKNLTEATYHVPCTVTNYKPAIAERFPEYLNWEVIVIDRPILKVCCYAAKVVIFTGLLDHLKSDAEIAAFIGHEVGHDVARHCGEKLTKEPWYQFKKHFMYAMFDYEVWPIFRKIEREADFIGLMIMASAGYDPQVAPAVFDRLAYVVEPSDYCSFFPSTTLRTQLMCRPEVMEDAVSAYTGKIGCTMDEYYKLHGDSSRSRPPPPTPPEGLKIVWFKSAPRCF